MIWAGRLLYSVSIQQNNYTRAANGAAIPNWQTVVTRRASMEPLKGREFYAAQQQQAEIDTMFRLRYDNALAAIKPEMRLLMGSRTFDIMSIVNVGQRNVELHLLCKERL